MRTVATNFSPCKGSYDLNQFPSNVMFGMNGFHISASGAIQGRHGPLVNNFSIMLSSKSFALNFNMLEICPGLKSSAFSKQPRLLTIVRMKAS